MRISHQKSSAKPGPDNYFNTIDNPINSLIFDKITKRWIFIGKSKSMSQLFRWFTISYSIKAHTSKNHTIFSSES